MLHLVKRSNRAGKLLLDKLALDLSFTVIFVEHLICTSHFSQYHGYSEYNSKHIVMG